MRIVIVGPAPPLRGGISEHTKGLYENLIIDHQVRIFSFSVQYPKIFFPGKSQYSDNKKSFHDIKYSINSINPFSWLKTATKIIKSKPDLVIFTYWHPFFSLCYAYIAKRIKYQLPSVKLISICHNIKAHESGIFDNYLIQLYLNNFDFFLLMSKYVEKQLCGYKKKYKSKVRFLPILKNYKSKFKKNKLRKEYGLNVESKVILFFGLIRPYKGLDNLLHSIKNIFKQDRNYKLIIAGESYQKLNDYKSIISENKFSNQIKWYNHFISNKDIEKLMILSDLLVLPYKSASQSGVLSQSWQFNLPSIVTNVGGLSEQVIDGKSGFIVEPNNIKELETKISTFFDDKLSDDMINYIKSNKNKYDWNYYLDGIMKLYESA